MIYSSRSIALLLALLPCLIVSSAHLYAGEPVSAAPAYRISGVVVSARDGSPIAQCRVSISEAGKANFQAATSDSAIEGVAGSGRRGRTGDAGQRRGGRGGAGAEESEPVFTDRRGQFSISVPKAGVWRLTGRVRGYRAQSYDQHEQFWSGIVLTPAAPEMPVTLRLTPDAMIAGTVFDEAGEAVRNAQVRVEPVRTPGPNEGLRGSGGVLNVTTDDRGLYEVPGLSAGKYRIRVNAQPWYATTAARSTASPDPSLDMVYAETWYPAASDALGAETIALAGGEERQADFHLTPVPSIHLLIPLPPQATRPEDGEDRPREFRGPTISREDNDGRQFNAMMVTMNGKEWDVGGLTPGSYQIRTASGEGQAQKLSQITIGSDSPSSVGLGSATIATKLTITIDGVEDNDVRQITLVDVDSRQSFRTSMRQERRGPGDEEEDNEPAGVRSVTAPPGRYEVYLNGNSGLYLSGLAATGAKVVGRTLELSGGSPKLIVHAAIGEGEVDGVARRDGKAIGGAMVLLVPAGYGRLANVAPVERAETNTDGSFTLANLIPAEYIVVVIDHGWDVNWRDSTTLTQYLANGTPINLRGAATIRKEIEAMQP